MDSPLPTWQTGKIKHLFEVLWREIPFPSTGWGCTLFKTGPKKLCAHVGKTIIEILEG